jgi:hypothetical protein
MEVDAIIIAFQAQPIRIEEAPPKARMLHTGISQICCPTIPPPVKLLRMEVHETINSLFLGGKETLSRVDSYTPEFNFNSSHLAPPEVPFAIVQRSPFPFPQFTICELPYNLHAVARRGHSIIIAFVGIASRI